MESINQQLNIEPSNRNSNIRSRMARGAGDYQVQLGTEDPSLDYYNDIRAISGYHNANGWDFADGDRDLGNERYEAGEEFNSAVGFLGIGYPPCVNLRCKTCKNECKTVQGLKWRKGGKECHNSCVLAAKNAQMDRIGGTTTEVIQEEIIPDGDSRQSQDNGGKGLSTGAMIGIGVGVLALGVIAFIVIRKRKA